MTRRQGKDAGLSRVVGIASIIMAVAALAVGISFGVQLYQAAIQTHTTRLVEIAQSQARLIEAIAEFDERYSVDDVPGGAWAATLSQLRAAHSRFPGFGETGEFTLARRDGDEIVFLLSHRHGLQDPEPVAFQSDSAEPMRQALSGTSGTLVGLDYRGVRVLAAYESMPELGVGIVAKIDLAEIRAPFVRAALMAGLATVAIILLGRYLIGLSVTPLLTASERQKSKLQAALDALEKETRRGEIGQRDLMSQEMVLDRVFKEGKVGMALVDSDLRFVRVSAALCEMMGFTEQELLDRSLLDIAPPDDVETIASAVKQVLSGQSRPYEVERQYVTRNGESVWFSLKVVSVATGEGDPDYAFAFIDDISDRKRETEELIKSAGVLAKAVAERTRDLEASRQATLNMMSDSEADRRELEALYVGLEQKVSERTAELEAANQALEAFSYSVSHDLKAPLRAIASFSSILQEEHSEQLNDEARRLLGIVLDNTAQMGQLIDDLLAFSRLGRAKLRRTSIDVRELVQTEFQAQTMETRDRRIELNVDLTSPIYGDPALIRQLFTNLISNAIKFTAPRDRAVIDIGCRTEGAEDVYYVKDNGVGFDMAHADKLFGVFQRLHYIDEFPGTGVGLAIVQRIINLHSGRVWAESQPDKGATFLFTLAPEAGDGEYVKPAS